MGDIPFDVPSFGNVGQVFDRFLDLGELAGTTERIALGVASIILPQRHPAHVAKAAASADVLSDGRLLLGIASGDCPDEYPAMGMGFAERSERFRESVAYIRAAVSAHPRVSNAHGVLDGSIDMLPKPAGGRLPLMITRGSQQPPDWVAANGDGWMTYPRDISTQAKVVTDYRRRIGAAGADDKPVMQSLYIDLKPDGTAQPHPSRIPI